MSIFDWLLVGHLWGDWIFGQSDYEAITKSKRWITCWSHAIKWTLFIWLASWFATGWETAANPDFLVFLALQGHLHALIDRRQITIWVIRFKEWLPIGRPGKQSWGKEPPMFLIFTIDQAIHISIQLPMIAWFLQNGTPSLSPFWILVLKIISLPVLLSVFVYAFRYLGAVNRGNQ